MSRPHLSLGAWIFASTALIAIAVPSGVYAATSASRVRIVGPGTTGTVATVDKAGQLLDAPTAPGELVSGWRLLTGGKGDPNCVVYQVPKTKALVITNANFTFDSDGNAVSGSLNQAELLAADGRSCSPKRTALIATAAVPVPNPATPNGDTRTESFGAGYAVPAGSSVQVFGGQDAGGYVQIYGYLVPKSAVSATSFYDSHS